MSGARHEDSGLFRSFGRVFPANTVLFYEGEPGNEMYVIQRGHVQLTRRARGTDMPVAVLPPGEFFGEMAIINRRPRTATAVTLDEAHLLVLDASTFEAMVRGNAEIAIRIMNKLAERLQQVTEQLEVLLLQDTSHRVVYQLHKLAQAMGVPDEMGVRIDISTDDLSAQIGVPPAEVRKALEKLESARLIHKQLGSLHLPHPGKLNEFLDFLDLKEQFGNV